jgi:hypothetical protein
MRYAALCASLLAMFGAVPSVVLTPAAHAEPSKYQTGEIAEHMLEVTGVLITPDGEIITAGEEGLVYGWDPATLQQKWERGVADDGEQYVTLAMRGDGELLASSNDGELVVAWVRHDQKLAIFQHELPAEPVSLAVSADGRWIAAGCVEGTILLFDASRWYANKKIEVGPRDRLPSLKVDSFVAAVAFSPDGKTLAATFGDDARLETAILSVPEGRELKRFPTTGTALAFSKSGRSLCAGESVYDTRTWQPRYKLVTDYYARAAAFSPDGKWLVTGGTDNRLTFWNALNGTKLAAVRAHDDRLNAVAISDDGAKVVSGARDGRARVWDAGRILADKPLDEPFHKLADNPRLLACWRLGGDWSDAILSLTGDDQPLDSMKRAEQYAAELKVKLPDVPGPDARPITVGVMMGMAEQIAPQISKAYGEREMELFQLGVLLNIFRDVYDTGNPQMAKFSEQVLPDLREGLVNRYGASPALLDAVEAAVKDEASRAEIQQVFSRVIREIDVYLYAQAQAKAGNNK